MVMYHCLKPAGMGEASRVGDPPIFAWSLVYALQNYGQMIKLSRRLYNNTNACTELASVRLEPRPITGENGAGLCPVPAIIYPPANVTARQVDLCRRRRKYLMTHKNLTKH